MKTRARERARRTASREQRVRTRRFASRTTGRRYLTTYRLRPPVAVCNCPGARAPRGCWHMRDVLRKGIDMSTAIVPFKVEPPNALLPTVDEMEMIKIIASTASAGESLLPMIGNRRMNEGEAAVIMLFGRELGIQPMESLQHIYVVKGRPETSTQLKVGLMQSYDPNSGVEIIERTLEKATVRITYKGRSAEFTATMADAKRAGLNSNPVWTKYPMQMLVWTATRTGIRIMAPDALLRIAPLPTVEEAATRLRVLDVSAKTIEELSPAEASMTEEDEVEIVQPRVEIDGDGNVVTVPDKEAAEASAPAVPETPPTTSAPEPEPEPAEEPATEAPVAETPAEAAEPEPLTNEETERARFGLQMAVQNSEGTRARVIAWCKEHCPEVIVDDGRGGTPDYDRISGRRALALRADVEGVKA